MKSIATLLPAVLSSVALAGSTDVSGTAIQVASGDVNIQHQAVALVHEAEAFLADLTVLTSFSHTQDVDVKFLQNIADAIREFRARLEYVVSELSGMKDTLVGAFKDIYERLLRLKDAFSLAATSDASTRSISDKIQQIKDLIEYVKEIITKLKELKDFFGLAEQHGASIDGEIFDQFRAAIEMVFARLFDLLGKLIPFSNVEKTNVLTSTVVHDQIWRYTIQSDENTPPHDYDARLVDFLRSGLQELRDRVSAVLGRLETLPAAIKEKVEAIKAKLLSLLERLTGNLSGTVPRNVQDKVDLLKEVIGSVKETLSFLKELKEVLVGNSNGFEEIVEVDLQIIDNLKQILSEILSKLRELVGVYLPWIQDGQLSSKKAAIMWKGVWHSSHDQDPVLSSAIEKAIIKEVESAAVIVASRGWVVASLVKQSDPSLAKQIEDLASALESNSEFAQAQSILEKIQAVKDLITHINAILSSLKELRNIFFPQNIAADDVALLDELKAKSLLTDLFVKALQVLLPKLFDLLGRLNSHAGTNAPAFSGIWVYQKEDLQSAADNMSVAFSSSEMPSQVAIALASNDLQTQLDLKGILEKIQQGVSVVKEIYDKAMSIVGPAQDFIYEILDRVQAIIDILNRVFGSNTISTQGTIRDWIVGKIEEELQTVRDLIEKAKTFLKSLLGFGDDTQQQAIAARLLMLDNLDIAVEDVRSNVEKFITSLSKMVNDKQESFNSFGAFTDELNWMTRFDETVSGAPSN